MYTLQNDELSVSILDPVADRNRLGSRYVTGGYIYQVHDARLGELFSGPQYPDPYPDVIDGQGAPDMFFTPLMEKDTPVGGEVGQIGVGRVLRSSPAEPFSVFQNRQVLEWVVWEIRAEDNRIEMQTSQQFQGWGYELTRRVELRGRQVHSQTLIRSTAVRTLPVRWFAHPFWPIPQDNVLCRVTPQVGMPENPGFTFNGEGYICRRADFDWENRGHFQPLEVLSDKPLQFVEKHPKVGQVTTTTDFTVGYLPIWGNKATFSFEPYFIREMTEGQTAAWTLDYDF